MFDEKLHFACFYCKLLTKTKENWKTVTTETSAVRASCCWRFDFGCGISWKQEVSDLHLILSSALNFRLFKDTLSHIKQSGRRKFIIVLIGWRCTAGDRAPYFKHSELYLPRNLWRHGNQLNSASPIKTLSSICWKKSRSLCLTSNQLKEKSVLVFGKLVSSALFHFRW